MIGFLRGTLAQKEPPFLVVEVQGVGYEVQAPLSTCFRLPEVGQPVRLCTHLVIREDQHILFGFSTEAERRLFREMLKVSGVGAKTALAILSGTSVEGFIRCVETEDVATLVRLPGVGRKTAERLIVEMRDRIAEPGMPSVVSPAAPGGAPDPRGDAFNALVALGYKPAEARRMLDGAGKVAGETTEEILRAVLKAAVRPPKT